MFKQGVVLFILGFNATDLCICVLCFVRSVFNFSPLRRGTFGDAFHITLNEYDRSWIFLSWSWERWLFVGPPHLFFFNGNCFHSFQAESIFSVFVWSVSSNPEKGLKDFQHLAFLETHFWCVLRKCQLLSEKIWDSFLMESHCCLLC